MSRRDDNPVSGPTVYALSTAQGRAGVAIIRISGPGAWPALQSVTDGVRARPRQVQRALFIDRVTGQPIDDGLVLWFPGPASFTGEDVAELHVHGGRAVIAAMLGLLSRVPGLRLAEPGEFTRRAFENGKLDLTQVEGLSDLIDAETEGQRALAFGQMAGALRGKAEDWRAAIIDIQALAEAAIDFSDEADVAADAFAEARRRAGVLAGELDRHLDDRNRGEILRDGFRVAVMGPPNAGKSSLINRLAGRDAVIVSEEAGTTRDVVELHLNLDGLRVIVADTAGVRETDGAIEKEGIRRGRDWAKNAHLVLWLADEDDPGGGGNPDPMGEGEGFGAGVMRVRTKIDLDGSRGASGTTGPRAESINAQGSYGISNRSGEGIDALVAAIAEKARSVVGSDGEPPLITQQRHRDALRDATEGLWALASIGEDRAELGAEHARRAAFALGRLTGQVDVEEILGAIFTRFCIGK